MHILLRVTLYLLSAGKTSEWRDILIGIAWTWYDIQRTRIAQSHEIKTQRVTSLFFVLTTASKASKHHGWICVTEIPVYLELMPCFDPIINEYGHCSFANWPCPASTSSNHLKSKMSLMRYRFYKKSFYLLLRKFRGFTVFMLHC